ncbi:thymidine phosphorylase [Sulfoacidibacillus thermotolerans]|uniref:Pyrimidine-nucleoside phosphorylase n=1 Tax=Sulfoacidibacillus thermotolerans TaxID=1765684 RepID=A0A2U3D6R4_SULT2|nr:thymidine phosphorylase [Sulfoacidibacillus thermotolerans]PWI56974.1 thymidine phosphorylase [Sulfoacidibacillus thermotolerans]
MHPVDYIARKRDGHELTKEELTAWIHSYVKGAIPDYQMAAWLMAVYLQGMSKGETSALTEAMVSSGETLDLSEFGTLTGDKHSTGGVGDKTSFVVGPLAAACGVKVAKMSGRGLSHTGGTIDKLESIAQIRTSLSVTDFMAQVKQIGLVICGQTADLAPADKLLYALRDVTATVDSLPLIASSIMSKKIAAGAQHIVLDVKVGEGAFMKTIEQGIELAATMVGIGADLGRNVVAYITDMNAPLGRSIGNALEVYEAVQTLKGNGPKDLTDICVVLAAEMVHLAKKISFEQAKTDVIAALTSGQGLEKFKQMVEAQGGLWDQAQNIPVLPQAPVTWQVYAMQEGYIETIHALQLGQIAMELGAGRERKEDAIDPAVGIVLHKQPGDFCTLEAPLATLYTRTEAQARRAQEKLLKAVKWSALQPEAVPHYYAKVTLDGILRIAEQTLLPREFA